MAEQKTTAQFIQQAKAAHGDRFDYSSVVYVNAKTKVEIACRKHGKFWQIPRYHVQGQGCPACKPEKIAGRLRKPTSTFVQQARKVHGDLYDYSKAELEGAHRKVVITCKLHGDFEQSPANHLAGKGCPVCRYIKTSRSLTKSHQAFVDGANRVHGSKYRYGQYRKADAHVLIYCKKHGAFSQTPAHHLSGDGCRKCGAAERGLASRKPQAKFIAEATAAHGGAYDYSRVSYRGRDKKVEIGCPKHGPFLQTPANHLSGQGCPRCGHRVSAAEGEIASFIESLGAKTESQFAIGRKSFDIRIDKVLIEYHGLRWHSTAVVPNAEARRKHEAKRKLAEANGFRYVAIYEDEWRDNRGAVESYLRALIGKAPKEGARRFAVAEVDSKQARDFYSRHHLLGAGAARGRHMALLNPDGSIAACMSIGKASEHRGSTDRLSLSRFCTDGRAIAGAASRLLGAFGPLPELVSYVDLDKFTGAVYDQLGFHVDSYLGPDYWTVWREAGGKDVRRHKTATKRDRLASLPGFDPNETEAENCQRMGVYQIYHSGRVRVVRPCTSRLRQC